MYMVILLGLVIGALADDPEAKNCLEQPDTGFCRAYFESYYYDPKKGDCFKFVYGGCDGNGNRYTTYDECMSTCRDVRVWESDSDVCSLPFESGTGSDNVKRYGFNNALGECTRFVYTGEGGNGNNFESLEQCRRACEKPHHLASACTQSKVIGMCDAYFKRYFYNMESGECEEFVYGGCQGNSNNFNSLDDCEAVCKA